MILGELEKKLLKYLWDVGVSDAKAAHKHFEKKRGGSLNTIQSTLDRLYKKELLTREKVGHAYHYSAAVKRKTLIGLLIKDVTSEFTSEDNDSLLAAFVSVSAELDEEHLGKLEKMIQDYRSTLKQKEDAC